MTACLLDAWRGEPILVSMGSLAHYMQETSTNGLAIRHFIHEGIGEIWYEALKSPKRHAAFVLVEEKAEGGDQLFRMAQKDPAFLDGFARTCEGGGVALVRADGRDRSPSGPCPRRAASDTRTPRRGVPTYLNL